MPDDPLAPFRRDPPQAETGEGQKPLSEHDALKLAIAALNPIPNSRLTGAYASTYELIPVLEKATANDKVVEQFPRILATLDLAEDALTELGRTDDGTPSIQALLDIQVIKREISGPLSPWPGREPEPPGSPQEREPEREQKKGRATWQTMQMIPWRSSGAVMPRWAASAGK